VNLIQSGSYTSANTGQNIAVVPNDSLSGSAMGNYVLRQPTGLVGNITPAGVTVTGTVVAAKPFDGNTSANLSGGVLQGVLPTDTNNVVLNQSGHFVSAVPRNSSPVLATDSLSGSAAANYALIEPNGLFANITPSAQMPTAALLSVPLVPSVSNAPVAPGLLFSSNEGVVSTISTTGGAAPSVASGSGQGRAGGVQFGVMTALPVALQGLNVSIVNEGINMPAPGSTLR